MPLDSDTTNGALTRTTFGLPISTSPFASLIYGHTDFCMAVGLFHRVLNAKVHYLGCTRVVFLGNLDGSVRYRIVVELL